jgi:hypothetical protein
MAKRRPSQLPMDLNSNADSFNPQNARTRTTRKSIISPYDDPYYTSDEHLLSLALRYMGRPLFDAATYDDCIALATQLNICGGKAPPLTWRAIVRTYEHKYSIQSTVLDATSDVERKGIV